MKETLDFIVIGAQKAGTTSLFEHLRHHPEISLPPGKEAPYFSHDRIYTLGWASYMEKAAFVDPERKWGTVSPHYMVGGVYEKAALFADATYGYDVHTVPVRIYERLPDVRLIAILRDPVERARSHHRMALMEGLEQRSFETAIDELLCPGALEHSRRNPQETSGYITWGEYARILAGYFDVFSRQQILVVFTEELKLDPERLLSRVHEFIGVTADFVPPNLGTKYRAGATERRFSWMGPYASLSPQGLQRAVSRNTATRAVWHTLPEDGRLRLRRSYERFAYRVDLWNRRGTIDGAEPTPAVLSRLRGHFAREGRQLTELLGGAAPWANVEDR